MAHGLEVLESVADLRRFVSDARGSGQRLGYAPTMGGLHHGHAALITKGLEKADITGASIFVNPIQFDNQDEVARYPSGLEEDLDLLEKAGAGFVFLPDGDEMYPAGFDTLVRVDDLSAPLCGAHRAGHFDGVATVVTKLLCQCMPDVAVFGEKDFQQLRVIQRLVTDLNIPVEILPCPTVREVDGLACSSRNLYLSPEQRAKASQVYANLCEARDRLNAGDTAASVSKRAIERLKSAGFGDIDYFELRAEDDLRLLARPEPQCRLFAAAWLGAARLIDNISVQ